jgi:cell division protein FtsB
MTSMGENGEGRNRFTNIWLIAIVIVGILILGDLNRRMANARRLERDAVQLETEVAVMATDRVHLMTSVAEATSESIIADWAHSDAKLVREGETLIIPLPPPGQISVATPVPGHNLETPNNWQVWWALIFGN